MSERKIVYSEEARSRALGLWETGHINAHGRRPWSEDYQAAVRQVLPALDRYATVEELIAGVDEAGGVVGAVGVAVEQGGTAGAAAKRELCLPSGFALAMFVVRPPDSLN